MDIDKKLGEIIGHEGKDDNGVGGCNSFYGEACDCGAIEKVAEIKQLYLDLILYTRPFYPQPTNSFNHPDTWKAGYADGVEDGKYEAEETYCKMLIGAFLKQAPSKIQGGKEVEDK